ncbi:MAG: hypothetical protein ABFS12_02595 [Bacteroidota bacterium]
MKQKTMSLISILSIIIAIVLISCNKNNSVKYIADFSPNAFSKLITNNPNNWEVLNEDGEDVLHLIQKGEFGEIRKPSSYAFIMDVDAADFELTLDAKCLSDTSIKGRDVIVYFGVQDTLHFYYVHLSNEVHKYHNVIGIVNGQDRVPIANTLDNPLSARIIDYEWHKVKINRDVKSYSIKIFVDDMEKPIFSIIDSALTHGGFGVGSFDDFGKFKNLELRYNNNL